MYLEIRPPSDCEKFSFLIWKNPSSLPYVRDLSSGDDGSRRVTGRYVGSAYVVLVENDEVKLVERLRAENKASYVSSLPYAVNPRNLKCAATVLKSALDGKVPVEASAEAGASYAFEAMIGPVCRTAAETRLLFEAVGLEVDTSDEGDARMVTLRLVATLSQFLQRVFLGAYALTARDHQYKSYQDSMVDSLVDMGRGWLQYAPNSRLVMRRLAGYRKGVFERVEAMVRGEAPIPDQKSDEVESKVCLHELRHRTIVGALARMGDVRRVVDLGCGDGALAMKLLEAAPASTMVGIDAGSRIKSSEREVDGRLTLRRGNVTTPYLEVADLCPDLIVMSEVIEHLVADDRELVMRQVTETWRPRWFVLTTPNRAYNATLGLAEGELRHRDHKTEYDAADLAREVTRPLERAGYVVRVVPVEQFEAAEVQPSFVVVAERVDERVLNMRLLAQARDASAPLTLCEVGGTVSVSQVRDGLCHPVYMSHRQTAFYLSPTIAPVDYDERHPCFLEHPSAAIEYYRRRGETELVAQRKYMGSRCHLLVFKDEDSANRAGHAVPLVTVSRGGFPFLSQVDATALWPSVRASLQFDDADFVALDTEVLPWSAKAGGERGLIAKEFRAPGEAARLYAAAAGKSTANAEAFLETLSWFSAEGPTEFAVFDVLATGAVDRRGAYTSVRFHANESVKTRLLWVERHVSEDGVLRRAWSIPVTLGDVSSEGEVAELWASYTTSGRGEGFVFKPTSTRQDLQSALKVRGRDYLRIIYGIDYLEPRIFEKLTQRGTAGKRRAALLEAALGRRVLHSYFRNMRAEHARSVAAFLGADGAARAQLDATL